MKKRFSEEQIIGFLREAEAGMAVKDLCRKHGFSEASYYLWRSKFGGMTVSEAKRLKELEAENARLKKLLAESMLENEITREAREKSGDGTGATVAGAGDDEPRTQRTSCFDGASYERQCIALRAARGPQWRTSTADRGLGAAAQALWRRHDLSEA